MLRVLLSLALAFVVGLGTASAQECAKKKEADAKKKVAAKECAKKAAAKDCAKKKAADAKKPAAKKEKKAKKAKKPPLTEAEKAARAQKRIANQKKNFAKKDANKNGKLCAAELKGKSKNPKAAEKAAKTIKAKDKDGDGMLSFEEFFAKPERKKPPKKKPAK